MIKKKKLLAILLSLVLLTGICPISAMAADTYHISNQSYTWMPSLPTSYYVTSAYRVNTSNACVDAYVYCVDTPFTFTVELEKFVLGASSGKTTSYTFTYEGGTTTSTRTYTDVRGKYFRAYFANLDTSPLVSYRVRFHSPSKLHYAVTINDLNFWSR